MKRAKGKLFVISAPSGSGKTTLCRKLLEDGLGLERSVSVTTRKPRRGEKRNVDYKFVSLKKFREMVKKKEFLEHEENFGRLYGTPHKGLTRILNKGAAAVLNIDVKGAMSVRRRYPGESVLIFILPPSVKALEKRLKMRMTDSHSTIANRLKFAKREMSFKDKYDYKIVNDRLDKAYRKLKAIIIKEIKEG